ncbi:hypothetical protein LSH36_2080g00005, partial [Paralvinella palmiformis]
ERVTRGIKLFIYRWGAPKRLLSDQWYQFIAKLSRSTTKYAESSR